MKKLFTFMCAALCSALMFAQTDTVYFVNADNWETVKCYAWNGGTNNSWPGADMTKADYQLKGADVYYFTANNGDYANCIFNNGSSTQTGNLTWTAGKYYYKSAWYTRAELESAVLPETPKDTVFFVNKDNWTTVKCYAWSGGSNNGWPGADMTKADYQLKGADVYFFVADKDMYTDCQFNCGGNTCEINLTWTSGKYYYNSAWYTRAELESSVVDPDPTPMSYLTMHGDFFGGWATTDEFTFSADGATATLTLTLAAGTYHFGVRVGSATNFTANAANITREANSTILGTSNISDMQLVADIAGEYVFTYTVATTEFTVTFPAGTGSNLIKVDAEPTAVKVVRDGQILIQRGGMVYTLTGQTVE